MMIRVALFGVVTVIVVGATIIVADGLINPAQTPNETITSRFPDSRGRPSFAKRSRPSTEPASPFLRFRKWLKRHASLAAFLPDQIAGPYGCSRDGQLQGIGVR